MIPRARSQVLLLALAALLASASGCDEDRDAAVSAAFVPTLREPGPKQVHLAFEFGEAEALAVSVRVRDASGIGSADLTLEYDPSRVLFRGWEPGSIFEQGGSGVDYQVAETVAGALRIRVAPRTPRVDVDAGTDSPTLVLLGFSLIRTGSTAASFRSDSTLRDAEGTAIRGVVFFGGTFVGS